MKVSISKESRKIITLDEAPAARKLVELMKEDSTPISEHVARVIKAAAGWHENCEEVYTATAEIAKNSRLHDHYDSETGCFDVWISGAGRTYNEFYIVGAYLSDIWNFDGDEKHDKQIVRDFMYVRKFVEIK